MGRETRRGHRALSLFEARGCLCYSWVENAKMKVNKVDSLHICVDVEDDTMYITAADITTEPRCDEKRSHQTCFFVRRTGIPGTCRLGVPAVRENRSGWRSDEGGGRIGKLLVYGMSQTQ